MFCPTTIQPHTSVYSVFCSVNAVYTAHAAKQRTGICRCFSGGLTCFADVVLLLYPAILHSLCNAGAHTRARTACTDTRYQRHAGRCTDQHNRPIIIRYIRVQGRSIPQTMPARRGQLLPFADCWQVLTRYQQYRPCAPAEGAASPPAQGRQSGCTGWHPPPGGAVQQQERGGRRGTIDGSRRISFRAFAR